MNYQTLESFVAEVLKEEIRSSRAELDRFTLGEMASEKFKRLVERFGKG